MIKKCCWETCPCETCQLRREKAKNAQLQEIVDKLHPRVVKLIKRGEPFIIIGCHEPYFREAYDLITRQENLQGTWTQEDRDCKRLAVLWGWEIRHQDKEP